MIKRLIALSIVFFSTHSSQTALTRTEPNTQRVLDAVTHISGIQKIILGYLHIHDQLAHTLDHYATHVMFSPDSHYLVATGSSSSMIDVIDVHTKKTVFHDRCKSGKAAAFDHSGKLLAYQDQSGAITLLDTALWQKKFSFHLGELIASVSFSPNGNFLLCGFWGSRHPLMLIDLHTRRICNEQLLAQALNHQNRCVSFSPDGNYFVHGGAGSYNLQIRNTNTGALINSLTGHLQTIWSCAFLSKSKIVASSSGDRSIIIWDLTNIKAQIEPVQILLGHEGFVYRVAYSPDGKFLASVSGDKALKIWDVENNYKLITTLAKHTDLVWGLCFSPDNKYIVSASNDKKIYFWTSQAHEIDPYFQKQK